ncbi:MAG: exodeoxyribonuclease V subunit gamma, partial [Sedimentisphaerales bacterium]|nr:exodeoxyribonuclease V subunit gamma [Sedimentisphaerales bacterium]
MTVRFILGRSGSGKTHRCLQQIRRALQADPAGPPLILLAPEQATFQLEQALLANGGLEGYHRARVVSFLRLAHLVLQQTAPPALEPLSESGKQMILRRLLQEHQDQLVLFGRSTRSSGFIAQLGGMISELRQYRKTPDDLIRQAERLRRRADTADAAYASLVDKLTDLALIYQAYREAIAGRFLDPDEFLDRLADCCGGAEIFRGAHLWLDGFAGFTGQQYHVLEAVLQRVADAHICLCLDPGSRGFRQADAWDGEPGRLDEMDLFHPTLETYLRLKRLIQNASLIVAESIVLPEGQGVDVTMPRFHRAGQLARLEAGLYADNRLDSSASESPAASELSDSLESLELPESSESLPSGPPASPEDAIGMQEVVLVETARRRSEVEAAARHILRLCRRGGYRFGQIAVILRDFGPYQELLETIFTDYGIAFFLDQRRPIRHHPCVELVRSALAALQTAFRTEHVLRYLKTDLAGIDRRAADRLENYALAHGIEHDRWWLERPWQPESAASSGPADSDRPDAGTDPISSEGSLDDYRRRAIDPLRAMRDELFESADQIPKAGPTAETATVRRISAALFGLLERLGVPRTLRQWQQEAQGCHDLESFQAHRQVYEALIEVLEELVESLGDVSVSLEQYAEILNTALSRMTLALIPPALDQVLIGTIERSRHPAVRAVFLLGLNEGVFPRNPSEDSLLSDPQRELLEESGFTLADSGTRKLLHESYLGYIALTRPSEFLWLSYPVADEKANELAPSPLLDAVRSALGSLPFVRLTDPDDPDLSRVTTVPQFAEQLARACAQNPAPLDASFRQVWSFVAGRAEWRPILQR